MTQTAESTPLTPEEVRIQRLLKIVVVGLGLLILFVLGIIVFTILGKAGKKHDAQPGQVVTEAARPAAEAAPFDYSVALPPQSMVIETRVDGDTLVLRLSLPNGGEEILVLDMSTGAVRGRVRLNAGERALE